MKEYLSQEEYEKIEKMVEYVLSVSNKKDAESYIRKLQSFGYGLTGRANNIFSELVCYVKDASGRVSDKDRRCYSVKSKLYELEVFCVE